MKYISSSLRDSLDFYKLKLAIKKGRERKMRTFILFTVGAIAAFFLAINIAPLVWAAFCIWLLYLVYKQFIHSDSTTERIIWVIIGMFILTIMLPVSILVFGIVALLALYVVLTDSKKRKAKENQFMNFEDEWNEFNY